MLKDKTKRYLVYWIISFVIIFLLSFSKDPFIDELASLRCSIYFSDCMIWELQIPTYYFFIKPITLLTFKIEYIRLINSILISFSIVLIIEILNSLRKLRILEEIIVLLSLCFIPLIYSSILVRPYSLSFFLSSISFFFFTKYLKERNLEDLKKSIIIDSISLLVFYFNIILIIPKFLYFLVFEKEKLKIFFANSFKFLSISGFVLLLYLFFLFKFLQAHESWKRVTEHYENYKDYFFTFLFTFPIELYKEQTVISSDYSSFFSIFVKILAQALFLIPIFIYLIKKENNEYLFIYFSIFITILLFNIFFSLITSKYLILSRLFIYSSLALLITFLIILSQYNKIFLIILLPISFVDYTIYRINLILNESFIYFPIKEIVEYLSNEEIIVTPYYLSMYFWYYENFVESKNLTIYEIFSPDPSWYKKESNEIIFLNRWKNNITHESSPIEYNFKKVFKYELEDIKKVFINIEEAKKYCKDIIKEIDKFNLYILVCR
ncbi:MAG: hypothetical protein KQA34_02420 [Candidatus Aenigmarchaeota archaeon]|nr:hypothetical protein [Candidatus Aenigmarchaeota archaeon]